VHRVAVLIPAYNEEATIRGLVERALRFCPLVIVVDDGSKDGTAQELAGSPAVLLQNPENRGKADALWRGAEKARELGAELIVSLDGDGQHAPEDIPRLLQAAEANPGSIVIGARLANRESIPTARYVANRIAAFWVSWACGQRLEDSQSGFRVYPSYIFDNVRVPHDRSRSFVFESEILVEAARRGHQCVPVPIAAIYSPGSRPSHFRPVVDIVRITRMIAWKLLSRGLFLQGLYRAYFRHWFRFG